MLVFHSNRDVYYVPNFGRQTTDQLLPSSVSRSGEGRGPPGLLGPRSGHHLLQRVPAGVRPAPLHPPLSRLRPGRVRRLLSGAAPGALPRLGPPGEGLQRLQSETRGALAGRGGRSQGVGKQRRIATSTNTGTDVLTERLPVPVLFF